ncbi:MAG TPA: hypothetical protein VIL99_16265 [Ignavibacteria bacterium]
MKTINNLFIYLSTFIVIFTSTINLYSQNNNSAINPSVYSGIYEGIIGDLLSCSDCDEYGDFSDTFGDICIYYDGNITEFLYDGSNLDTVNLNNGVIYNKENKELGMFLEKDNKIVFLFKKNLSKYNVLIKTDSAGDAKIMIDKYRKDSKEFLDFWSKFKQIVQLGNVSDFLDITHYPVVFTETGWDNLTLLDDEQELDYLIKKIFIRDDWSKYIEFESKYGLYYFRFPNSYSIFSGCFLVNLPEYRLLFKKIGSKFWFIGCLNSAG